MIDLTPLEVRKKKGDFRKALRGYEPALVDDFLDIVADRLDDLVRENTTLQERVTRAEAQLSEHREREKALTDALVTAQEMREGVRAQAVAEAEQMTRGAKQEAERLLKSAKTDAEQTLRSANAEAEQTLKAAEQESTQMRAQSLHAMQREEEALSRLRARQQQLVQSYRTFLAREMEELQAIAETLDDGAAPGGTATPHASPDGKRGSAAGDDRGGSGKKKAADAGSNTPVFPDSAPRQTQQTPRTQQNPQTASDLGLTIAPPPLELDAVATVMGAVEVELLPDPDEEPFAPEPVDDWEDYPGPAVRSVNMGTQAVAGDPAVADDPAMADDPAVADELALHDAISHDEVAYAEIAYDAVEDQPEAEGVTGIEMVEGLEPEEEIGAPDHDATALLENALKAGYRLELDDEMTDEALPGEAADDDGGQPRGWLDAIIDDEEN
jgi:DivIVA domain-containing protein